MTKRLLQSQVLEVSCVHEQMHRENTAHIQTRLAFGCKERVLFPEKRLDLEIMILARKILHVFFSYEEFK